MGLGIETEVLGFPTKNYVKIVNFFVDEVGKDKEGKLYTVKVSTIFYTNESKTNAYKTQDFIFEGQRNTDFTIENFYNELKELKDFEGYEDVHVLEPEILEQTEEQNDTDTNTETETQNI